MTELATLARIMFALRLLATVISLSILVYWTPSAWRLVRRRRRGRDGRRAFLVALAVVCLLFQTRWLWPHLSDLVRMRLWVTAQAGMVSLLLAGIYSHGAGDERFRAPRVMAAHACMAAICIVGAWVLR